MVAEELATSVAQIRALVKRHNLEAIQIGGRRQWRVELSKPERTTRPHTLGAAGYRSSKKGAAVRHAQLALRGP
jgi:hypothetical protein